MDKFEETVVNPNLSLNNFEVKVPAHEDKPTAHASTIEHTESKQHSKNNRRTLLLLVGLIAFLAIQVSIII